MKLKEYRLDTSKESINMTYLQAKGYFDDVKAAICESEFDLFNDNEELSLNQTRLKYNEINRRLQTLGQSFELYIKYILLSSKLEQNPKIKMHDLWGKWIRGHKIVELIDKAENLIPKFKKTFYTSFNAYYGFGKSNVRLFENDSDNLFSELIPKYFEGEYALSDQDIDDMFIKHTSIYESCRYNTQLQTDYSFKEVYKFISFVAFFANMIYLNNNSLNIDYNVAYIKAKLENKQVFEKVLRYRTKEEIESILNNEVFRQDGDLIAYLLSHSNYSLDELQQIINIDDSFKKTDLLFYLIINDVKLGELKKCKDYGINVHLMMSGFNFEELKEILNIPGVGDYIHSKPTLLLNLPIGENTIYGLSFKNLLEILNLEDIKKEPKLLDLILTDSKKMLVCLENIIQCTKIFSLSPVGALEKNKEISFTYLKENILANIKVYKLLSLPDFSLLLDAENTRKIIQFLRCNGIYKFSAKFLTIPFYEVYAVFNYIKKNGLMGNDNFEIIFERVYEENCMLDINLKIWKLPDSFLCANGLIKQIDTVYSRECDDISLVSFKSVFD